MSRMKVVKRAGSALMGLALCWSTAEGQQDARPLRTGGDGVVLAGQTGPTVAPAPWIQEDPGARAYSQAREALNSRQYEEAAEAFARLRDDFPGSAYVADSYYWQAFALSRMGGRGDLREARSLLREQGESYRDAGTYSDAQELYARIESQLARQGDSEAAANITRQAQDPCGPDSEIRAAALQALMNMNADRAIPILQEVLKSRDACSAELREQAVFLVAQKMSDESVDILLDLAHRNPDPDPGVREQAVFWLSQVHSEEAFDALVSILRESDDPELQENAIFAISQHRSDRGAEVLREFAEREDAPSELRENAVFWIGQSPGGVVYLKDLWTRVRDQEVKEQILHAVAQGDRQEAREWLVARAMDENEDTEIRENALFWAGQTGGFSIDELRELFGSFRNPELKEQVIFVASQRREAEAVDFLMEVAENEENGELRENAIFWLGQSDDPRVADFLLRIIGR